jgi:hypothetical protein
MNPEEPQDIVELLLHSESIAKLFQRHFRSRRSRGIAALGHHTLLTSCGGSCRGMMLVSHVMALPGPQLAPGCVRAFHPHNTLQTSASGTSPHSASSRIPLSKHQHRNRPQLPYHTNTLFRFAHYIEQALTSRLVQSIQHVHHIHSRHQRAKHLRRR